MIEYRNGDLLKSDAEAIVNSVNCVGVMGRGIALQFKKQFPDNFKFYEAACKRGAVEAGKVLVYPTDSLCNPKYIINFPTKRHWRGISRLDDIKAGLNDLANIIKSLRIMSIAVPPLGCGLGGLEWSTVREVIETAFAQVSDVRIYVFEPNGASTPDTIAHNRDVPKMTPGRAALVALTQRYLEGLLDPFVTLLEIHKLMYFLQESGEPLRLKYVKAKYGPYAENLSHVLNAVEGHLLSGYVDGGDIPNKQIVLVPGAQHDALAFLTSQPETNQRLDRVAQLVDGFETPFGLELLSTVHWVMKREAKTQDDIIGLTYAWGQQKSKFSPRQIEIAVERLTEGGW